MPAVDKDQAQGGCPQAGGHLGSRHNGYDRILKPPALKGRSERLEGIHPAGVGIEKIRIKVFLAGLLFLGSPMMIDGKQNAVPFLAGGRQIKGGLTTITADLQTGSQWSGFQRDLIKTAALFRIEKAFGACN